MVHVRKFHGFGLVSKNDKKQYNIVFFSKSGIPYTLLYYSYVFGQYSKMNQ